MKTNKQAFFRFEASFQIGAGHAIRSMVLADALQEIDKWEIKIITSLNTYNFIPQLQKYPRIDPEEFVREPVFHELHVVDHYGLDQTYEQFVRGFAQKIMV